MKTFILTKYGTDNLIYLEVSTYPEGNLAVMMTVIEDGQPEPWSVLTVNLDGVRSKDCAFIDTNNNGNDIITWIEKYNLAEPTGNIGLSGYCSYPEYRFHPEILQEIDPNGYQLYLDTQKQYDTSQ